VRRDEAPGDRRSNALVLTTEGEALMPKLHETSAAHEQHLIDFLGQKRHAEMRQTLAELVAYLGAEAQTD
jgi:DNA-binding MarR family transcriptional regulator